jgi:macrolide transport system ATP-binding/permease protein
MQDLRYGFRRLLQAPGFTAIAVLTLALGIGANNAIFTVVNAVLLHPIAVGQPETLVNIYTTDQRQGNGAFADIGGTSELNFEDLRDQNTVLSGLAGISPAGLTLGSGGDPEPIGGQLVTGNYFDVLGVRALLGRTFTPAEDRVEGANPICVMSYALWQRRFAGDRSLVGKTIELNGQQFTVIGVMPPQFHGTFGFGGPGVWIPFSMHNQVLSGFVKDNFRDRRFMNTAAVGRLKPGVSFDKADAEIKTIGARLEQEYPVPNKGRRAHLLPLMQSTVPPQFRALLIRAAAVLMAVVGIVLLIACANLANLLLARSMGRHREIAVRIALGASRGRLVRQLMTESVLIALLGALASFAVAWWARALLVAHRPPFLQNVSIELSFDANVMAFTIGLAILTSVLFGLAPAIRASRPDLAMELKERVGIEGGARGFNLRNGLVVAEVTLSLVALIGAGLFVASLVNAQRTDVGYDVENSGVLAFNIGAQGYTQQRGEQFYRDVVERVKALPGVQSASVAEVLPLLGGGLARSVFPEGQEQAQGRSGVLVAVDSIDTHYLETARIALLGGRPFTDTDSATSPNVAIVNQSFAKRFFPGQDVLNKRFKFFGEKDYTTVVGIAPDAKFGSVGEDPTPFVFVPVAQLYQPAMTLFVRSSGAPDAAIRAARNEIHGMDPHIAITNVEPMRDVIAESLWPARTAAALLGIFALLAIVLAMVGIYGVMSYSIRRRVREIGIRMALGARPADVLRMVIGEGMLLVGVGVGIGVLAGFALSRLLTGLLYGAVGGHWLMFSALSLALALIAFVASYVPARRATRVDPMVALHYE